MALMIILYSVNIFKSIGNKSLWLIESLFALSKTFQWADDELRTTIWSFCPDAGVNDLFWARWGIQSQSWGVIFGQCVSGMTGNLILACQSAPPKSVFGGIRSCQAAGNFGGRNSHCLSHQERNKFLKGGGFPSGPHYTRRKGVIPKGGMPHRLPTPALAWRITTGGMTLIIILPKKLLFLLLYLWVFIKSTKWTASR